ncbi:hypothetical protein OIE69_34870 [Actinacidiphila glaucinigra]|uniref:hypothetical protein n=1 Tax=Actinacidiphila glaucinigra TaxID=235986 RepID=UPI002DD9D08C|nr:hypothetical protein [Actinacidiphila glaucinigra]WSD63709.1 hypothetical protein OIE69_34870 [Actinacidiphila glaucinigra]
MSDDDRRWAWGWHGPLNVAAMHLSGVLLVMGFAVLLSASGPDLSYGQTFGLLLWIVTVHVVVQIPVGAMASRWAARGRARCAGIVAAAAAGALTWVLSLLAGSGSGIAPPFLWWQTWAGLCVSLGAYVWLCTLRRSTVRRFAGRIRSCAESADLWIALRLHRGR